MYYLILSLHWNKSQIYSYVLKLFIFRFNKIVEEKCKLLRFFFLIPRGYVEKQYNSIETLIKPDNTYQTLVQSTKPKETYIERFNYPRYDTTFNPPDNKIKGKNLNLNGCVDQSI